MNTESVPAINDPEGEHVVIQGVKWYKFFTSYQHEGSTFTVDFFATSQQDAEERLRSIRTTAVEAQQISMTIPAAVPGSGIFVKLFCAWRNLWAPLLIALLCSSCAHQAVIHHAPNPLPLRDANRAAAAAVQSARVSAKASADSVRQTEVSHQAEIARLATLDEKAGALALRVPEELKPEVAGLQQEIALFRAEQTQTAEAVRASQVALAALTARLEEANAKVNEGITREGEYTSQAEAEAKKFTATDAEYQKASVELAAYKRSRWTMYGLIVLAGAAWAALWFFKPKFL